MYSKERGNTYEPRPLPVGRQAMYRQPERRRVQVPPNYSGHAIVDGEERPLGGGAEAEIPLADRVLPMGDERPPHGFDGSPSSELDGPPSPHFDGLPRVSDLPSGGGDSRRRSSSVTVPATFEETRVSEAGTAVAPAGVSAPARGGLFDLGRFPFGRGLGLEELLILGLILFLLRESGECEDRGDLDETVILLGLVLLLG